MDAYDCSPALPPHFVAFAWRYLASCRLRAHPSGTPRVVDPGPFLRRRPHRLSRKERMSPPRFLGDPCVHALLFDPGGTPAPSHCDARIVAFRTLYNVGSTSESFEAPSHGLHTPCVRFAAGVTPAPRNTRFRWMASPFRFGTHTRRVTVKGFRSSRSSISRPPFPGFAWRKQIYFSDLPSGSRLDDGRPGRRNSTLRPAMHATSSTNRRLPVNWPRCSDSRIRAHSPAGTTSRRKRL